MKRAFFAIRSVLAYFTILPAGRFSAGPAPQTDALSYLPLIGTLIGGVAGGAAFGLSFIVPHSLVVAAAFTLPILLTGAIHFDGFLIRVMHSLQAPPRRAAWRSSRIHATEHLRSWEWRCCPLCGLPLCGPSRRGNIRRCWP